MRPPKIVALRVSLLLAGCGKRVPESTTTPPGIPRVGWVIMTGDRDNPDDDYVCQSGPRTPQCIVAASRPDHQVFADVHFYFHPAAADTKYTGTVEVGFMRRRSSPSECHRESRGQPGATHGVGLVSSAPGPYTMTISVVAEGAQRRTIHEQVQVEVQQPRAATARGR